MKGTKKSSEKYTLWVSNGLVSNDKRNKRNLIDLKRGLAYYSYLLPDNMRQGLTEPVVQVTKLYSRKVNAAFYFSRKK